MIQHYVAILLVAAGTYTARFLPMRFSEKFRLSDVEDFLTYSSTALISALFITSFISFPIDLKRTYIGAISLILVFLSYNRWKNLGISVLVGVLANLVLSVALNIYLI